MSFLRAISGYRMAGDKRNDHIRQKMEITDIRTVKENIKVMAKTFRMNVKAQCGDTLAI